MLKGAHGKAGIEKEMKGGRVCIERIVGLSVLAFMLIKTFPTSQCLTERKGVIFYQWKKKKDDDEGKRKRNGKGKKGEIVAVKGKGKDRCLLMWSWFGSGERPIFIVQVHFAQI